MSGVTDFDSNRRFSYLVFWLFIGVAFILNIGELFVTTNPASMNDGMEPIFGWPLTIISQGGIGFHTAYSFSEMMLDGALALGAANLAGHLAHRLIQRKS